MSSSTLVAVLAGGEGRRLGGGKPTVPLADRPLISYVLSAAHEAQLEAVVIAKRATVLPALSELVLHEPEQPRHPLCGVLAALDFARARSPARALLLVPCDMPLITGELLRWMAGIDGAAMLEVAGRAEPLPARCLPAHRASLQAALDARDSLRAAIGALSPRIVGERELRRFGAPERLCFNVNSPGDLLTAERWLEREAAR